MKVRFTARARSDIATILPTIAADSPRAALAFENAVMAVVERIVLFPLSGRLEDQAGAVRSVTMARWGYKLFYGEGEDEIVIITIRSSRRRPPVFA